MIEMTGKGKFVKRIKKFKTGWKVTEKKKTTFRACASRAKKYVYETKKDFPLTSTADSHNSVTLKKDV